MKIRWIVGSISAILLLGVIGVHYQLSKTTHLLIQRLSADYSIDLSPEDISLSYFPPALTAHNVHYQQNNWQIFAQKLMVDFNYIGWLSNQWIDQIELVDAKIKQGQQLFLDNLHAKILAPQTTPVQGQIKLIHAEYEQTHLQGQFILNLTPTEHQLALTEVSLELNNQTWNIPQRRFQVSAKRIQLMQRDEQTQLKAERATLNSVVLPEVKVLVAPNYSEIVTNFTNHGQFLVKRNRQENAQVDWLFQGKEVPTAQIFQILGYTPLVLTHLNLQGKISEQNRQFQQFELAFNSEGSGVIKGYNLLGLLGNVLPFFSTNVESELQDTHFESLKGDLIGNSQQWHLQQAEIQLHDVNFQGNGNFYLPTQQCEWQFIVRPVKAELAHYHLNLDLDGDCLSPSYRIRVDDALKKQLKSKLQRLLEKL